MASIEVEFTIIAKDSEGQAIHDNGMCKLSIWEESLDDVFTNIFFHVLKGFVLRHLGKDYDQLEQLKQYAVILENFKYQWE